MDKKIPQTVLTIRVPPELKTDIETCAAELGLSTGHFAKNVLSVGLDEYHTLKKFGVIRACVMLQAIWTALPRRTKSYQERTI